MRDFTRENNCIVVPPMKRGPRKPRHASSVRATTSKECFSPKAGYKSSFHKGTDFSRRRKRLLLTLSDLIPYGIRSKRPLNCWRCYCWRCRCCSHCRSCWSCCHLVNAPTNCSQYKTTVSGQDPYRIKEGACSAPYPISLRPQSA